jgi:hypothetical protein
MRERVDSMSRLFLTVFINRVLEDWGQIYTDIFARRLPFLGRWGGGGTVGFFIGYIEVHRFLCIAASVQVMLKVLSSEMDQAESRLIR